MRNKSGKALTIFLVLIAIILISLTAISVFLFVKQVGLREQAEYNFSQVRTSESAMRIELDEVKKQKNILDEKVKESEFKIESLLEELDLAEGIREEVKKENRELKDNLAALKKANDEVNQQLVQKEEAAMRRAKDLQEQLNIASERNKMLEETRQELEKEYNALKARLSMHKEVSRDAVMVGEDGIDVDLERIVVSGIDDQGRVVSIDHEAAFVIVNLGERQGVLANSTLSVYDGDQYIGDILVTKVLPEMAAADFVDPLTSQQVSEGNLVKLNKL